MHRYPWELLVQLGSHIEHALVEPAHETLDRALELIADDASARLPVRKLRCAQVASFCLRGAHRGGASSHRIFDEHLELLEHLAQQRNWRAVRRLLHQWIDRAIRQVQPARHTNMQKLIGRIRDDLERSLDSPRTLAQYASEAGVSTAHLSRCFTTTVGRSFREHRRVQRTEAARRMLTETSLKVHTIARRLGLRDPSQFIAQFRRDTGLSPAAYRLRHQR